jgi:hypothetical protein
MARRLVGWLAFLTLAVACLAAKPRAEVIDRVLAIVNGRLITLSDVRAVRQLGLVDVTGAADPQAEALDRLIDRTLVLQEVERYAPPEPDAAEVARRIAAIEQPLGSHAEVVALLASLGVSEAWLERWVRDDFRVQAYITQRFSGSFEPTGDEIENYFREHPGEFTKDGQPLGAAEAQQLARERLMAARRKQLGAEWLAGLRRRAEITKPGG